MSELTAAPTKILGGKGAVLLELQAAGFRVPEFEISPSDLPGVIRRLGTPLAVRSSATLEDGPRLTFAGQFESFLNVRSSEELVKAIEMCRESLNASSVIEYCKKNDVDPGLLGMEVIVQRMIQPELAGVAFTVNPVTGDEEVVIEACEGLADKLLASQESSLPPDHPLMRKYAPEIEAVAKKIQRHFGVPQDIEFAIENGALYVLQSRPITRIGFAAGIGEWTNADFRDGGVSCGVCSTLMWSLYEFIWENSLKGFLREIKLLEGDFQASRMFFGRPYWNLGALKQCLAKLPGFVEREFDDDLSVEINYEGDGIHTRPTLLGLLQVIPTIFAIRSISRKQAAFDQEFLLEGFEAIERKYEEIPEDVDSAFRELVEKDYVTTESNYFRTIFSLSLTKLSFQMSFPDADYTALVAALPELRHMEVVKDLREMSAQGNRDVQGLLLKFRHHSRGGQDVQAPRWDEDIEFVEELLQSLPETTGGDPRPAYELARAEELSRLPYFQRRIFKRKLDRLRKFVWLREEMRDVSSRMYYIIRRYALEIARRRGIGDDIFFMTFREILEDDCSNIQRNREIYESYRNFKAPNEIGTRFSFNSAPAQGTLRGIGASPGKAKGIARVARSVQEAMGVEKDTVLICPFTEPGWIPILDRVAGVVTETGGLLSHAAVICREYGIPAVLGVADATERIRDGRAVVIHGSEGYVEFADGA